MKEYRNVKPQLIYYWLAMACSELGLLIDGHEMGIKIEVKYLLKVNNRLRYALKYLRDFLPYESKDIGHYADMDLPDDVKPEYLNRLEGLMGDLINNEK
jgi:hypothetical protein|tara:strand:- start:88 stop:384 length:297 start_codon:yes stop_codon:yes gene_type:complete